MYIAFKACEKALKAAWLAKDANKFPHQKDEHSLVSLATNLGDQVTIQAVCFYPYINLYF